jgi:hypothetical protein
MTIEHDVVLPVLGALADAPEGKPLTGELRGEVKKRIRLDPDDVRPLVNRTDVRIDQTIRNLKSHKSVQSKPVALGLLEDVPQGFAITDAGRAHLRRRRD